MEKYAVIVAGGGGTRMGTTIPKQFLEIRNQALILYTAKTFLNAFPDIQLILVFPAAFLNSGRDLFLDISVAKAPVIVKGGETRFHSVKNGLEMVPENAIVFVHDAVRCLVTTELVKRCYDHALENGSAIPVVPVRDSLRILSEKSGSKVIDRDTVRAVQTPQTFQSGLIKKAFTQDFDSSFTDEATVLESAGVEVSLVPGEENNIKVTYPSDLIFAESVLNARAK